MADPKLEEPRSLLTPATARHCGRAAAACCEVLAGHNGSGRAA